MPRRPWLRESENVEETYKRSRVSDRYQKLQWKEGADRRHALYLRFLLVARAGFEPATSGL
jgi:hypothetical protein